MKRTSGIGTILILVLSIASVAAVYFTVDNSFYARERRSAIREREAIATALEKKRAEEKAIRAEQRTEFQASVLSGLTALGSLVFVGVIGGIVVFFASAGVRVQARRIANSNVERYKILDNPRLMLDMQTGETIDRHTGCIIPNQTTDQKLLIFGQTSRIEALGNTGQRFSAAMGKTAIQGWQPKQLQNPQVSTVDPLQLPEPTYNGYMATNTVDLMEMATDNEWVLAQSPQTGQLSTFKLKDDVNLLISGARGQGKTELAKMLMAYARMNRLHTVIADGKGGVDFQRYGSRGIVEWFDMNEETLYPFLVALEQEYQRRTHLLTDAEAEEIDEYVAKTRQPLKRIFVIIEEYIGALKLIKVTDPQKARSCVAILGTILSRARATGIHVCVLSQTLDSGVFDNSIKANLKYLTYKLPGHQYKVLDVPKSVKSLPQYTFCDYETDETALFKAQYVSNDLDLLQLPRQNEAMFLPLLSGANTGVLHKETQNRPNMPQIAQTPPQTPVFYAENTAIEYQNTSETPVAPVETPLNTDANTSETPPIDWQYYASLSGDERTNALRHDLPKIGEPIEVDEVQYVIDAIGNLPSDNAVYEAVWGSKNPTRKIWLDEIKQEYFTEETEDA